MNKNELSLHIIQVREVTFDDFTTNEDGSYWSQMCEHCQQKLKNKLGELYDDHGGGTCGVRGCSNPDSEKTRYINIPKREARLRLLSDL